MIKIPFPDQNDFLLEAELDGITFFLHLAWNDDAGIWTLGLENAQNGAVLSGIALAAEWPLLRRFRHLDVPKGELVAVSLDGLPVSRQSFADGTAELIYVPAAEIQAA